MKKIIGLTIAAIIVLAIAGVGTFAFFSDTETSSANSFVAGTLDLKLTGGTSNVDSVTQTWTLSNLKPGDTGGANGALTLVNNGSIDGYLNLSNITVSVTPGTGESHVSNGTDDLSSLLLVWMFMDDDSSGAINGNDINLYGTSGTYLPIKGLLTTNLSQVDYGLARNGQTFTYNSKTFASTTHITLKYKWASTNTNAQDNSAQGDSLTFGFTTNLTQDVK